MSHVVASPQDSVIFTLAIEFSPLNCGVVKQVNLL